MKQLILIFPAAVLAMLLAGCKTPEEWQQQTNQRTYDKIVKQGQHTIKQNQQKMMFQNR
jgi:outer membrane protein assembly factor BamE (lipoprotein component of BamABCDE complex)